MEMPGRTRGETRALRDASRDNAHRYGIPLDHAAMVSMLARGEATSEIVRVGGSVAAGAGAGGVATGAGDGAATGTYCGMGT